MVSGGRGDDQSFQQVPREAGLCCGTKRMHLFEFIRQMKEANLGIFFTCTRL
jgi:hypothetical protein